MNLLITWLVTAISLLIITWLPLGIKIKSFKTGLVAVAVFGVLNAILQFFAAPLNFVTFGLFAFVVNGIAFGLASEFVDGFYIRSWLHALIGPIALGFINSLLFSLLG